MRRVLVIAPHPDDESIGCGGAICWHVENKARVRVIFLTSGERGVPDASPSEAGAVREAEARAASELLGVERTEFFRAPDSKLRVTRALRDRLAGYLDGWAPDRIYVTHRHERHADHRAAARLVVAAIAQARVRPEVRTFEVWTPLQEFVDVLDVSDFIERKVAAVRQHRSQTALIAFDEAVLGLARYRGEMYSWHGGAYAEVFGTR